MATIIEMPKLSDTMTVGTLVKWLKKEGDKVESGEMLAEIETDKATMELENFDDGVILACYTGEGEEVAIGAPICAIGDEGEEAPPAPAKPEAPKKEEKSKKEEKPKAKTETKPQPKADPEPAPSTPRTALEPSHNDKAEPASTTAADGSRIMASPLARRIAGTKGISLEGITGTGPGGRIVKDDVLAALESGATSAASSATPAYTGGATTGMPVAEESDIPVSKIRSIIASRLLESKTQYPHFYLEIEVDAKPMLDLRASLNAGLAKLPPEQGGMKLSVNDFILKAATEALRRVPAANCSWMGETIRQHGGVHMAFAVAIPDGLVTPVIRDAHAKGLRSISAEARSLAEKARDRKLTPDEMTGSTFTVSNLGMYGIRNFYGIINPPNAAILCVGATEKKPVVDANDNIVVGHRLALGLSCDHRVVDGAVGSQYLAALREILETPALMLV